MARTCWSTRIFDLRPARVTVAVHAEWQKQRVRLPQNNAILAIRTLSPAWSLLTER